jgi:phosphate-selective porin OprO and OprP
MALLECVRLTSCMIRMLSAIGVVFGTLLSAGAPPAGGQVRMTFEKRPSFKVGDLLTADIRFKSQVDFRVFAEEPGTLSKPLVDLHRTRIGVEGTLFKAFEYQIESELNDASKPLRDVYLQTRLFRGLQARAGQFKIPFSLDQLTSSMDLDFMYRSLAATFLAPGRDVGVVAFGRVMNEVLRFQAGVFRHGGDNVRESERTDAQADRTYAGRLVVRPWAASDNVFRTLSAGVAFTSGRLPAGPNGVRGKTVPGDAFFEHLFVNGHRRRIDGEFQWRIGPVGLQGEFIQTRDQRFGQGIDNQDLPNVYARGWYAYGTWLLTGERKKDSVEPARPFLRGGTGAIEIAGRVERLASRSPGVNDGSFSSPRAPWVMPRADDVWTGGVNWYWNDFVKLQANVIRERRTEDGRVIAGEGNLWSRTFRVQLGF